MAIINEIIVVIWTTRRQPGFVQTVRRNFYVDDCLKSLPSEEEAVKMVVALTKICQRGAFC